MPGNRLELNARMAVTLGAPVLMVVDAAEDMGPEDVLNKALVARNGLEEQRAEVLGVIVNKVDDSAPCTTGDALLYRHNECLSLHGVRVSGFRD